MLKKYKLVKIHKCTFSKLIIPHKLISSTKVECLKFSYPVISLCNLCLCWWFLGFFFSVVLLKVSYYKNNKWLNLENSQHLISVLECGKAIMPKQMQVGYSDIILWKKGQESSNIRRILQTALLWVSCNIFS